MSNRLIDAAIHEHVFGFSRIEIWEAFYPSNRKNPYPGTDADWVKDDVPHYSDDVENLPRYLAELKKKGIEVDSATGSNDDRRNNTDA